MTGVAQLIMKLHSWWKKAVEEADTLRDKMTELSESNRREVEMAQHLIRKQLEEEKQLEIERLRIQSKENIKVI